MKTMLRGTRRVALAAATSCTLALGAGGCAISTQQEVALGQQYAAQANQQLPIVEDAALQQYFNALGNQIASHGRRNLDWHFYIVNTDEVNAFALPGGFVYVNRGVIEKAANLSELAGVLGHEISHVELRHSAKQLERQHTANLGLNLAYILMGRAPSGVEQAAIQVGGTAVFASYSRQAETEADDNAVPLLVRSGIDPHGLLTFFQKLLDMQQRQPGTVEQWFTTHPTTRARIADVRRLLQKYPQSGQLQTNSQAFERFKSRMQRYPAPPPQYRSNGE